MRRCQHFTQAVDANRQDANPTDRTGGRIHWKVERAGSEYVA
jgi:hypothetical protein